LLAGGIGAAACEGNGEGDEEEEAEAGGTATGRGRGRGEELEKGWWEEVPSRRCGAAVVETWMLLEERREVETEEEEGKGLKLGVEKTDGTCGRDKDKDGRGGGAGFAGD